jgi:predicted lipid-binding transport protein (Tim44 family)
MLVVFLWLLAHILGWMARSSAADLASDVTKTSYYAPVPPPTHAMAQLDPGFSRTVFTDMVGALFARVHEARGTKDFAPLKPFFDPDAYRRVGFLEPESGRFPDATSNVILGSVHFEQVEPRGERQRVRVSVLGNLTETRGTEAIDYFVRESWTFERPSGLTSPRPEAARSLGCPGCGAPCEATTAGRCTFCEGPIPEHRLGWRIVAMSRVEREVLPPLQPDLGGVEAGTTSSTRVSPELGAQMRTFSERHPSFDWNAFGRFARETFLTLQAAWGAQDQDTLRSLETPSLFKVHRFWLERYRAKSWVNKLAQIEVDDPELVRVDVDAYYEAVVVRIFAKGLDFTTDAAGHVVLGSMDTPRSFSEYWTFVRAAGASQKSMDPKSCPACGAPRDKLSAGGVCGYCDAAILDGQHGWVLSLIEQDEEYFG